MMTNDTVLEIDDNEAQLLQAMSIDDELPVYKAYAGSELSNSENIAKMFDIVEAIKTV